MNGDTPVREWPCSYYVDDERRWVSGCLSLTLSTVRFSPTLAGAGTLLLPLSRLSHIDTESSCLIFSALTLQERDGPKHWFCYLKPSTAAARHALCHFWREGAVRATFSSSQTLPTQGQRLLGMVSHAQQSLSHTGRVLGQQGEQFHHMIRDLDKVESDLGVADKLLCELESPTWSLFRKLPWTRQSRPETPAAPPPGASASTCTEILSIPVVFYPGGDLNSAHVDSGSLVLLSSALEIRRSDARLAHRFQRQEVDEVRVHSTCDVCVRQRHIGRPDVCFRLLSAHMPEALCVLELQYKKKMEFTSDYTFQATPGDNVSEVAAAPWGAGASSDVPLQIPAGEDLTPLQLHTHTSTVSEEEAQELKKMLLQLKCLAVEAECELDRQEEVLDVLLSSSERSTLSMDKHSRRMRRLL